MPSLIIMLIGLFLGTIKVQSHCYPYWNGDIAPSSAFPNTSYCYNVIQWAVSDEVIANSTTRDSLALSYYVDIYNSSYISGEVDKTCLGIIQYIACAAVYPTCTDQQSSIPSVCSFLCDLMTIRCGTDSNLYQKICVDGRTSSKTCSRQSFILATICLMLMILFIL